MSTLRRILGRISVLMQGTTFLACLALILLAQTSYASQRVMLQNDSNGRMMYFNLDESGKVKNTTRGDGWDFVSDWIPGASWKMTGLQESPHPSVPTRLMFRNSDDNKIVFWALTPEGKLMNRTQGQGWDYISEDSLPSKWRMVTLQRNADSKGNDHMLFHNSESGKIAYWKITSDGIIKNRTQGDGWDYLSDDLTMETTWSPILIQKNADRTGHDHLLWYSTSEKLFCFWKLDENGKLLNPFKGNGWDIVSDWKVEPKWRLVSVQLDADRNGSDHLLFHEKESGKVVYWKLDSTGKLKNRILGDGWNYISTNMTASSPWTFSALEQGADQQGADHLLWCNTDNGKLAYWKLNQEGVLKNSTKDDGWGNIAPWQVAPSWRITAVYDMK